MEKKKTNNKNMTKFDRLMAIARHPMLTNRINVHPALYRWYRYASLDLIDYVEKPVVCLDSLANEDDTLRARVVYSKSIEDLIEKIDKRFARGKSVSDRKRFAPNPEYTKEEVRGILMEYEKGSLEGHYLYLRIDLTQARQDLLREVEMYIDKYQSYLSKEIVYPKTRQTYFFHWQIFDMKELSHLNIAQITEKLTKINDHNDSSFKAYQKQIERAYKKACKMIDQVGREAGLDSIKF